MREIIQAFRLPFPSVVLSRNRSQDASRCECVCFGWKRGACFVLIRRRGGQACSREPMLAGSEHQLSYLASSNRVPTATWHPAISADSRNITEHGEYAPQVHLFPNRKHPLHIFRSLAWVKVCWNRFRERSSRTEEINPVKRHRREQKSASYLMSVRMNPFVGNHSCHHLLQIETRFSQALQN